MHWKNTMAGICAQPSDLCTKLNDFIRNNINFMKEMMEKGENDSYWHHVDLFLLQTVGLRFGYSELGLENITGYDFL